MNNGDYSQSVAQTEKVVEKASGSPKFQTIPELAPFSMTRVPNFTCPSCGTVLPIAIAINGVVQGWCGKTGAYIRQNIPIGGDRGVGGVQ